MRSTGDTVLQPEKFHIGTASTASEQHLQNRVQYVRIDDVARLIAHILHRGPEAKRITILNVAGRGDPLTIARCVEISGCKVIRVPGQWACKLGLRLAWRFGISAIPPEITPYIAGQWSQITVTCGQVLPRQTGGQPHC